ncbi:ATP-binding protein [Piscirickettsia salmonis]|nr:ATP-binding protein [Piscirickettsia salmonis]QHS31713.1 HAMP domain-containing protein [Piscirickettsia salmonis]QIX55094.1 HAMP domain-containing protein [Piscirickettsia salmonis]
MKKKLNLYWRIFIWFWLSMVALMLGSVWLAEHFDQARQVPVWQQRFINSYRAAAETALRQGGPERFYQWSRRVTHTTGVRTFLVDTDRPDLVEGLPLPRQIKKSLIVGLKATPRRVVKVNRDLRLSAVVEVDGRNYRLVLLLPPEMIRAGFGEKLVQMWSQLLIAAITIGFLCWLLSRYLTRPLRNLQLAVKEISRGNFQHRVGTELSGYDEFAELGREFDRMAVQIEHMMTSQERMLRDVSHELRSPLARLQVALELARHRASEESHTELDRIGLEAERLNDLIGEILFLTRLKSAELVKEPCDLTALLTSIVQDAQFELSERKNSIVTDFNVDQINANARWLSAAVENILRNALFHTEPGTEVRVSSRYDESSVIISVEDSGSGVFEVELDTLFDPFYRTNRSQASGYGLGLAIAKQVVEVHHGSIHAYNKKPRGLVIDIHLPL